MRLAAAARRAFNDPRMQCYATPAEAETWAARRQSLDLVLIGLDLPGNRALDALKSFRSTFPTAPTVVVSARSERNFITAALRAGAAGYLSTHSPSRVIVAALRLVVAGEIYVPRQANPGTNSGAPSHEAHEALALRLTKKRREVLRFLLEGYNNARIARELKIKPGTVKQHVHAIFKTLGVSTRAELFALAARGAIRQDGSPITKVI